MSVCGLPFLLSILVAAVVFQFLGSLRLRQIFFFAGSVVFLATHVPSLTSWIAMGTLLIVSYFLSKRLASHPSTIVLSIFVCMLVASFVIVKQYAFAMYILPDAVFQYTVSIVGLSYLLFRILHVAVDATEQQISDLTLWNYVNYNINPFGLIAGPIQRYQHFQESWSKLAPVGMEQRELHRCLFRMFIGILKVALISAVIINYYHWLARELTIGGEALRYGGSGRWFKNVWNLMAAFYCYPMYLYFNFSGYCDIVISAGRLFGMVMPENFDTPFFSRNLIEYWTRWHRTLGFWIRDYVFNPLYKEMVALSPRYAPYSAYFCLFTALFLTGIWHGSTWNYFVFGVLNGVGVCVVKYWEKLILRRWGREGMRKYMASPWIHYTSMVITFHFVCLTMFLFPGDLHYCWGLLKAIGWSQSP